MFFSFLLAFMVSRGFTRIQALSKMNEHFPALGYLVGVASELNQ